MSYLLCHVLGHAPEALPLAWIPLLAAHRDPGCTLSDYGHLLQVLMDRSPAFSFGERG